MSGFINTTLGSGGNDTNAQVEAKGSQSAGQFFASLITASAVFAIQVWVFLLIKDRLARIYQPRTYLVPEKERTRPPDPGWWKWIAPVLTTSNSEFVGKCGLDAYFFLRYLRTLLKIFIPAAAVIIPVLIPLNAVGGIGSDNPLNNSLNVTNVTGLNQLAWGNVPPDKTNRYWAHWTLALLLIAYVCFIAFDELRNYIRMRQAYLTSPQHRLRASATTVLVSSIPRKWCNVEALDGLYDVFPGGLRNIWINRNFDELTDKINKRNELATQLEAAETELIRKCFKKHEEHTLKAEEKAGKKRTKKEQEEHNRVKDQEGRGLAQGVGLTSGNPHQVQHNLRDVLEPANEEMTTSVPEEREIDKPQEQDEGNNLERTRTALQYTAHGLGAMGKSILGGVKGVNHHLNNRIDTTSGFVAVATEDERASSSSDTATRPSSQPEYLTEDRHTRWHETDETRHAHDATAIPRHSADAASDAHDENNESVGVNRSNTGRRKPGQTLAAKSMVAEADTAYSEKPDVKAQPGMFKALMQKIGLMDEDKEPVKYPTAFQAEFDHDPEDARWKKYLAEKDRDTMRLPVAEWMFSLPLIGKKVDTIHYCREEIARLNVEIEEDQAHPERFPVMNSAFIQFNHQIAAHMACQAVSHHAPKQMAPRLVEIDPNDVIWDNMSIPWWQAYLRRIAVFTIVVGMVILWAVPVAFTSALSQLDLAAARYSWLHWLLALPSWFRSFLQGVLPPALLGLLLFLLPLILRFLVRLSGSQSGMLVELSVQNYYFFFLFVQLFIVVTIASALTTLFSYLSSASGWSNIPGLLGQNIPKASNYFFSYMLLQALSVSAGALLQVGSLISWFIFAPLFDSTARDKFLRQTQLSDIQWGTFFPVYTNLACIGLIYSVISPLILVFNVLSFSLFWFVYRYNTLYVTKFTKDTGGLLYPNAINTTFVGIYMMEITLIGMFFLVRDQYGNVACAGQGIGMIVILILTAIYQFMLNHTFNPLFRYMPITLEDDAVRRDEEFALALKTRHTGLSNVGRESQDIEDRLEADEKRSREQDREAEDHELQQIQSEQEQNIKRVKTNRSAKINPMDFQDPRIAKTLDAESRALTFAKKTAHVTADVTRSIPLPHLHVPKKGGWADRDDVRNRRASNFGSYASPSPSRNHDDAASGPGNSNAIQNYFTNIAQPRQMLDQINNFNPLMAKDVEAQRAARNELAEALFGEVSDQLEDLDPEERDALVQRAFQHSALRARRPVIWLPRDELGVSDDEIRRMSAFSKNLWVSNIRQGLDSKGECVYSGPPPDFSEIDLIVL